MLPSSVSEYKQSTAKFLYKLAVRTMRVAYRQLPLDSTIKSLDSKLANHLSSLADTLTPAYIRKKYANRFDPSPLAGIPSFSYVEAAHVGVGDTAGVRLSTLFGPLYMKPVPGGFSKVVVKTSSVSAPSTFLSLSEVSDLFSKAFNSEGKLSVISKSPIVGDSSPYRIELTTTRNKSNRQYAIVHNGGRNDGDILQTPKKSTDGSGREVYSDAVFPTAGRALRALSVFNTGVPLSTNSVSPLVATAAYSRVAIRYETLLLDSESTKDAYSVLDEALNAASK